MMSRKRVRLSLAAVFFTFFVDNLSWSIVFPILAPYFLDVQNHLFSAEVSIYLVPSLIGAGYGPNLLQIGQEWLKNHHPEIRLVTAQILSQNKRSQQAFKKAGFHEEKLHFIQKIV